MNLGFLRFVANVINWTKQNLKLFIHETMNKEDSVSQELQQELKYNKQEVNNVHLHLPLNVHLTVHLVHLV